MCKDIFTAVPVFVYFRSFFVQVFTLLLFKEVPWVIVEFGICRSHPFRRDQITLRLSQYSCASSQSEDSECDAQYIEMA